MTRRLFPSAFFSRLKRKSPSAGPALLGCFEHKIYAHIRTRYLRPKSISKLWRFAMVKSQGVFLARLSSAIVARFPIYAPVSRGKPSSLATMTLSTINRIPIDLAELAEFSGSSIPTINLSEWGNTDDGGAERLGRLLNLYGSDKTRHGYHELYAQILGDTRNVRKILEIGLGSNNEDVVSNMSADGSPGASLRAFRDLCENAEIYGADVDSRILFADERIQTFWVDQLDRSSLHSLRSRIPNDFDLVIDDGLHAPDANISTLILGLQSIRIGGWVVIEDINPAAEPLWKVVAALLPKTFSASVFQANYALVFAAQRVR